MHTSRFRAAILLLTVCAGTASAQGLAGQGAAAVSPPTVSIQMGYDVGFNVGTSDVGSAFDMSLILAMTDNLQVGVTFLNGDGAQFQSYRLLDFYYALLPRVGALISIGSQTTGATGAVAGLGLYSNIIGKDVAGSLQTGLRLLVDYLAPLGTGFNTGTIRLGIVAWVGV
jgi:hypothetical protein